MRFLSLFSGFECASLAWEGLGWQCAAVAEVDPAPCTVLAYRYPNIPNLGDVKKITRKQIEDLGPLDLVVFGSPCQDLSIAGKREGLKGKRSGLFFTAMRIVRWAKARFALWENVPGAFSSHNGRDFASVVGEMAGISVDVPEGGWRNSGFLLGPEALIEWAVLDAQFFGVPQRRRRVFALRDSGDWSNRPPILLEPESLCGYPPPRRQTGEGVTHSTASSLTGSGRGVERCGDSRGQDPVVPLPYGMRLPESRHDASLMQPGVSDTQCLSRPSSRLPDTSFKGRTDAFSSTGEISHCLNGGGMGRQDFETETLIAHALRADGFDASEDGTGRGTPIVPVAQAVAFDCKASGRNGFSVGEQAPTLRSMGHADSHANAGGQIAVMTLAIRGRDGEPELEVREDGIANAVLTPNGGRGGIGVGAVAIRWSEELTASEELAGTIQRGGAGGGPEGVMSSQMAVRRLTPTECERLQAVPDGFTLVPRSGKPMADGPRYKMLGNGMAVCVMRWIGTQLDRVTREALQ